MADVETFLHVRIATCPVAIPVPVRCDRSNPLGAVFVFPDEDGPRPWEMAVDLLRAGLDGPAGEGDVRVLPAGEGDVAMRLLATTSDDPSVTLLLPRAELVAFLDACAELPTDVYGPAVDEAIARCLDPETVRNDRMDAAIDLLWDDLGDEGADR